MRSQRKLIITRETDRLFKLSVGDRGPVKATYSEMMVALEHVYIGGHDGLNISECPFCFRDNLCAPTHSVSYVRQGEQLREYAEVT